MVKKSKLLAALDAHKGRDFEAEKRKKQLKAGEKASQARHARKTAREQENGTADSKANGTLVKSAAHASEDEDSEVEENYTSESAGAPILADDSENEAEEDELDEDEEDVALSDLSASDREDTVPHQRLTINNGPALLASQSRISLLRKHPFKSAAPFHIHNSLISTHAAVSETVPDPNDDLKREETFYAIARSAVTDARKLLKKEGIPFTRPADYFAEMVKSEGQMERIHKKQYDDAADRKGREEARKLRDAKKFGKKVQIAKEQERAKLKRDTLDKIKDLKRSKLFFFPLLWPFWFWCLGER
jgi:rRNA-processing protein EBP2